MEIKRIWAMPNRNTFLVKPIRKLIQKYTPKEGLVVDPFANNQNIKEIIYCKYISNDLDPSFNTDYNMEAQDFMRTFKDSSVDLVLFDPPYSGRQVSECYKKLGKTVTMEDTNSKYFVKFKREISRIVKPNGFVISCGWNSNGIGKNNGFEIVEILLVPHGGGHYDTIVVVETKKQSTLLDTSIPPQPKGSGILEEVL